MLTAQDIKNIAFSNSRKGYNIDEVDVFLDKIEADYIQYERIINQFKTEIEELKAANEEYKNAQNSIQNVLLNAQKLADQIVNEAREKSEEIIINAEKNISAITAQEKELANAFELKAVERKSNLQRELDEMIEKANLKAKSITDAAEDSVKRQQILFDKLRLEIAAFKTAITAKYKEHLSILQDIPDTVKLSPEEMTEIIYAKIDAVPNPEDFILAQKVEELPQDVTEDSSDGFTVEKLLENADIDE